MKTASPSIQLEQSVVSSHRQDELIEPRLLWHETVRAKLDGLYDTAQFANFARCGKEHLIRTCKDCGRVTLLDYQCSVKWCPRCQWKISRQRAELISAWAKRVRQPKHLVLTEANHEILTQRILKNHLQRLRKFRRSQSFRHARGGCLTVEVTNEGRGWHLHSHWLVDVDWLDPAEIARTWARLAGQQFAIVKVKDARPKEYQLQVAKYVCKPAQLASWPAERIAQFVWAIRGRRFFFAFGSLQKLRPEIKRELAAKRIAPDCECGACNWQFETERLEILNELRRNRRR